MKRVLFRCYKLRLSAYGRRFLTGFFVGCVGVVDFDFDALRAVEVGRLVLVFRGLCIMLEPSSEPPMNGLGVAGVAGVDLAFGEPDRR